MPPAAKKAVHENKIVHGPAYWLHGLLWHEAYVVKQRHVRREMPRHPTTESGFCHGPTQSAMKFDQCDSTAAHTQDERPRSLLVIEAQRTIEGDIKWWH